MDGSDNHRWTPCGIDVRKLDWQPVVDGLQSGDLSEAAFYLTFGKGIRIFLEHRGLDCIDVADFVSSVYFDLQSAARFGVLTLSAQFPEMFLDIVSSRARAEMTAAFWITTWTIPS